MKISLFFLFIAAFSLWQVKCSSGQPAPSANLYKCYTWGDPGIQTWHASSGAPPAMRLCQEPGMYELIRNNYVTFSVRVRPYGYMVELTLTFYNGTSKKSICTMVSDNFVIEPSDDCARYGISYEFVKNPTQWAIYISYPKAEFTAIVTHKPDSGPAHFVANTWLPKHAIPTTTGMCSNGRCSSERDSTDAFDYPQWKFTSAEATTICRLHYDKYLNKLSRRRAPHQRNTRYNGTIQAVLNQCLFDVTSTGMASAALSGLEVLMVEEITTDAVTLDDIGTSFRNKIDDEIAELATIIEEAEVEVNQFLGIETSTTTTMTTATMATSRSTATIALTTSNMPSTTPTTTTAVPLAPFKCGVYQDMYIQTWHPKNEASPPIRTCLGASANFELVRNKYVRFTLRTAGSVIDELTLFLFDGIAVNAICTVTAVGQDAGWMDCEQNGIKPNLIKTATHETLTVYYAKANFTTIITRDIGINVGRFNINVYQNAELAVQSTGICNLSSPCT